jgi:hypothetical protein
MRIRQLSELIWRTYQNGTPQASAQKLRQQDITQKIKLLFADAMRQRYYESMSADMFGVPDYSFSSPVLSIKRFDLPEAEMNGRRRADMGEVDLYRLPSNAHFTNLYPVGACGNDEVGEITQVSPGEENFYINNPDLRHIQFYVVKGRGVDTYNIPPCVKSLDIETTYDLGEEVDIDMSIGSAIYDTILGIALGVKKQYYSEEVQKQMESQNIIK